MTEFENVKILVTAEEAAENLADFLWAKIVTKDEEFFLSLSGGSTPKLIFQSLAERYSGEADWEKVQFFWGDERCVPPDDEQSNFGMAKKYLLDGLHIKEEQIFRIRGEAAPTQEAERYGNLISKMLPNENGFPVFDFTLLGLGIDGHTASIFPDQIGLFNSNKICETAVHPESGQRRITITGGVINSSKTICFAVTGESKSKVIREIVTGVPESKNYPAALVQGAYWFLDREAATSL